jgi:hypothetical protein
MRTLELGFALCEIGGLGITGASFGRDTRVVMLKFGSEPWFELELNRTER